MLATLVVLLAGAETLTGDWQGARTELAEHGFVLDLAVTGEVFYVLPARRATWLGHLDLAVTLDTAGLGLWPGGKAYALGQGSSGDGVNDLVGSSNEVSNLEARGFTQLAELFYEQKAFDDRVTVRIGKQDANRDFGTPRYAGNFLNNNFGMYPTAALPSYPTTGLGATAIVDPTAWLSVRAAIYQGDPQVGQLAIAPDEGAIGVGGLAAKHTFLGRHGGTTSGGAWAHTDGRWGVMFQNDERVYSHPDDPEDGRGLNVITRLSWTHGGDLPFYAGMSLAWHGMGERDNDTVGLGVGFFTLAGGGSELFFEAFYKMRVTHWLSLQPDLELYRTPEGVRVLFGLRVKLKV